MKIPTKEEQQRLENLHNEFGMGLCDLTEKAEDLGVIHIAHVGIAFFTQMALDCAPTLKDGRKLVRETIRTVKREPV